MPMKATPTVAMVVHELPVSNDTTAQQTHVSIRNIRGLRHLRP